MEVSLVFLSLCWKLSRPFLHVDGTTNLSLLLLDKQIIHITDIGELDGGKVANIAFPNKNDLTYFTVSISPDSGYWKGATYVFSFAIPPHYPHSPPKVECQTKIYHPNIDLQGKVCLNILREDWKPVLDINSVIYGLIYLFYEPNPDDPLNHEAAELFRKDVRQFERLVKRTLAGGILDGVQFERLL
jgi:ubiquitin-conjugating enzyme E2 M